MGASTFYLVLLALWYQGQAQRGRWHQLAHVTETEPSSLTHLIDNFDPLGDTICSLCQSTHGRPHQLVLAPWRIDPYTYRRFPLVDG
jgi:hypothetical protein